MTGSPDIPVVNPVPVEARAYQGQRAGVISRTLAASVDFFVVVGVVVGCYVGWLAFRFLLNPVSFSVPKVPFLAFLVAYGVVLFLYLATAWATTGRTFGAGLMGLRVVNFRGRRLHVLGAVARSAFCTVFPLGLFWCAVNNQNRSLQDIVLRTSVIYDWTKRKGTKTPHEPEAPRA
jgi:uncharacterized RDD family membrane protein YckC